MFTLQDWQNLKEQIPRFNSCSPLGSCEFPCPNCKVIGFFSWREAGTRKYQACKFCGFWQEIDGEPYFCIQIYCLICYYLNWNKPDEEKHCNQCGKKAGEKDLVTVPPASEDKNNPCWKEKLKIESKHQKHLNTFKQVYY